MNGKIYGECVQGASHIRNGVPCQDSYKQVQLSDEITVIAVADGHGSASCPYSKTGSKIAVNVFCHVMETLLHNFCGDMDFLMTYLNREGEVKVAQAIDAEWKRRVWKAHVDNKRERNLDADGKIDKREVYQQYGTTLLGLFITPTFLFAFQLGDGDLIYVNTKELQPVIEADKILGTETHSLCKMDAWKKAITTVRMREAYADAAYLLWMSTDGFANSYRTQEEFEATCKDYFRLICENGFKSVSANLRSWLKETSELGCGDDITVVLAYFEETAEPEETEAKEDV